MKADDFVKHIMQASGPARDQLLRYANYFQVMVQQHAACNVGHSVEEPHVSLDPAHARSRGCDVFALTHEYLSVMARTFTDHGRLLQPA